MFIFIAWTNNNFYEVSKAMWNETGWFPTRTWIPLAQHLATKGPATTYVTRCHLGIGRRTSQHLCEKDVAKYQWSAQKDCLKWK